jgi:hypothetical protein
MSDSTNTTPANKISPTPPRGPRPFVGRKTEQGTSDLSTAAAPRRVNLPFKPYAPAVAARTPSAPQPDVVAEPAAGASTLEMEVAAAFDTEPVVAPDANPAEPASELVTQATIVPADAGVVHASPAAVAFTSAFDAAPETNPENAAELPDIRAFGYDGDFLTEEPLLGLTSGDSHADPIDEVDAAFIATGSTSLPEGSPNAVLAAETLESIARRLRMGALEVNVPPGTDLTRDDFALATVLAALLTRR